MVNLETKATVYTLQVIFRNTCEYTYIHIYMHICVTTIYKKRVHAFGRAEMGIQEVLEGGNGREKFNFITISKVNWQMSKNFT